MTKLKLGDAVKAMCPIANSTPYGVVKALGNGHGHDGQCWVLFNDGFSCWANESNLRVSVPSWDSLSEGMTLHTKGTNTPHVITHVHGSIVTLRNLISQETYRYSMTQVLQLYNIQETNEIREARKLLESNGYKVV